MNKIVDRRMVDAAELAKQQERTTDVTHMIYLQEQREKLLTDAVSDLEPFRAMCKPWTYVAAIVAPAR